MGKLTLRNNTPCRPPIRIFAAKGGSAKRVGESGRKNSRIPPTKESPKVECDKVQTVICILAGGKSGITQPTVWQNLHKASNGRVGFAVYTDNQGPQIGQPNFPMFWKPFMSNVNIQCAWGDTSLVKAELGLYRWATDKYPNASWFIFVSCYCLVTISRASFLLCAHDLTFHSFA